MRDQIEEKARRARSGDKDAFNELLGHFQRKVAQMAARYAAGSKQDAEDIAQAGLLAIAAAVDTYDPARGASFSTYAVLCANGRMIDEYRRLHRDPKSVNIDEAGSLPGAGSVDEEIIAKDLADRLPGILSAFERQVFERRMAGEHYRDIARHLDVSEKSVDNAIKRARQKINGYLKGNF